MGEIWEIKLTEGGVRWLWMLEFLGGLWCWCGDARFGIPEMETVPFRRDVREGVNNGYLPPLRHPRWVWLLTVNNSGWAKWGPGFLRLEEVSKMLSGMWNVFWISFYDWACHVTAVGFREQSHLLGKSLGYRR